MRSSPPPALPAALLTFVALLPAAATAQTVWQEAPLLTNRHYARIAYDPARDRLVLFGGQGAWTRFPDDTWELGPAGWELRRSAHAPPPRELHALAHDPIRGRTVLYGGRDEQATFGDTWEWDGTDWTQLTPPVSPGPRRGHAMVWDAARQRIVLFGGSAPAASAPPLADTWEWDGSTWTLRTPATSPPGRSQHVLAYDAARGRVVLFGGSARGAQVDDTWEWDGNDWHLRTSQAVPPARLNAAAAYDPVRQRVVLYGGFLLGTPLRDTWEWDGNAWTPRTPLSSPPGGGNMAMEWHGGHGRLLLTCTPAALEPAYEYDGNTWTPLRVGMAPSPRERHALADDPRRSRVVLFGGLVRGAEDDETWEWDGAAWRERVLAAPARPPARAGHALAFDPANGSTLLFGGSNAGTALGDTWSWDGATWLAHQTSGPSPRAGHMLATDPLRRRVVLFGGHTGGSSGTLLGDTWEWDGARWNLAAPPSAAAPSPRRDAAMAFDATSGTLVLFGGQGPYGMLDDTWQWNGTQWTQLFLAQRPPPRARHALASDEARGRLVLFGGLGAPTVGPLGDTWEWSNGSWLARVPGGLVPAREHHAMAFDGARGEVMLFGGFALGVQTSDTWRYRPLVMPSFTAFGTACGASPVPTLQPAGGAEATLPWIGETFGLAMQPVRGNAAALLLGASAATWNGLPLPVDLSVVGMPGCWLHVSAELSLPAPVSGGTAVWALPLPPAARLLGGTVYVQAFALDPGANPLGGSMSRAAAAVLGGK